MGLTGRSWACARAATRRKWVTPQPAAVWTTSIAAGGEERAELLEPGEVLPAGDRGADPAADGRVPLRVPPPDGFLDPGQVQGPLELADVADRLLARPRLVDVEHQARPGPLAGLGEDVPDQCEAVPVALDVEAALELRRAETALGVGRVDRDELGVVQGDVQARGVGGHAAVAAAEQPPQRFACRLRLDVPQRGVERADGAEHRARVPGLERPAQHPVVEGGDAARVLALDGGEDAVDLHVRSEADAGDALVGLDHDDRHPDEALGVHAVGVADRASPVLDRGERPVSRDAHGSPSWTANVMTYDVLCQRLDVSTLRFALDASACAQPEER